MTDIKRGPLISIIIPCYNYARYLDDLYENLAAQHYQHWECLMVDNASSDNTPSIIQRISEKDRRFKYLFQPVKGPSAARNMGIKAAKGDYIQLLDADDLFLPEKLSSAIELFQKFPETDLVYSDMRYFADRNPEKLYYSYDLNEPNDAEWMCYVSGKRNEVLPKLLKGNIMVISSPLIKSISLKDTGLFNEALAYNEDWDLWLRMALANKQFLYDNNKQAITLIRVHYNSHSTNLYKMYFSGMQVCMNVYEQLTPKEITKAFTNKILHHEITILNYIIRMPEIDLKQEFLNYLKLVRKGRPIILAVKRFPLFAVKILLLIIKAKKFLHYKMN